MKKVFLGLIVVAVASLAFAIDPYTTRDVRDPVKLKARLNADFATVAAGVGVAAVTNASLTQQSTAITATAVVTPQTYVIPAILADGTTNAVASMTNGTVAVTVVNGGVVLTNITLTLQKN